MAYVGFFSGGVGGGSGGNSNTFLFLPQNFGINFPDMEQGYQSYITNLSDKQASKKEKKKERITGSEGRGGGGG